MDSQPFIESGIIESYLLGLASEEEQNEVKKLIHENPDLEEFLIDSESRIKEFFDQQATPPPPAVRDVIQLRTSKGELRKRKIAANQASQEAANLKNLYLDVEVNDTHIKVHKYWRPAFIAIFILSKIFLIASLYYYFKTASLEQEVARLRSQVQQVK